MLTVRVRKAVLAVALSFVLMLALFALAACADDSYNAAGSDYDATTTEVGTEVSIMPAITIAALYADDLLPLKIAYAEGLLEERGLDVAVVRFETVQEQHAAFLAGEADALIADLADVALLADSGADIYAIAAMQDLSGGHGKDFETYHQAQFEVPPELLPERVLAVSRAFLLGELASGEDTAPEFSAEVISTLIAALGQAVGRANTAEGNYVQLFEEQGFTVEYAYDAPLMPTYPFPDLPDRELGEPLLRWLYENGHLTEEIYYDDLIFIPNAP